MRRFGNAVVWLLFLMGVILGVLRIAGVITISWWWPAGLVFGPWVLFLGFMLFIVGGTEVASVFDRDPDSHKK